MPYALKNLQTTGNPDLQFYFIFPEKGVYNCIISNKPIFSEY